MPTAPATTCPPYCTNPHREQPGEEVIHESALVRIPQAPGRNRPMGVQVSQADYDMTPMLHVGDYTFDAAGAERLLTELAVHVGLLSSARAACELAVTA